MDISYCMPIANLSDWKEYKELLDNIISLADYEVNIIRNGEKSCWNVDFLEKCVIPEMVELQQHVLRGELFLKYGKQQRMLESTHLLTDSVNMLSRTLIGTQIRRLQAKINSQIFYE